MVASLLVPARAEGRGRGVQLCQKAYRLCQTGPDMDDATNPAAATAVWTTARTGAGAAARNAGRAARAARRTRAAGSSRPAARSCSGPGAGVGVAELRPADRTPAPRPETPPADLTAALDAAVLAERALLADLARPPADPRPVRQVIAQARADHTAHLDALRGVQRSLPGPKHGRRPRPPVRGAPRTRAAAARRRDPGRPRGGAAGRDTRRRGVRAAGQHRGLRGHPRGVVQVTGSSPPRRLSHVPARKADSTSGEDVYGAWQAALAAEHQAAFGYGAARPAG